MFSVHVPFSGNNLAHYAFHPEHLLKGEGDGFGIVGWRIVPRPRFYLRGTYLAWCFLYSSRAEAPDFYRHLVLESGSEGFRKEQAAVFAFCLLEQFVDLLLEPDIRVCLPETKGTEAQQLFEACVRVSSV